MRKDGNRSMEDSPKRRFSGHRPMFLLGLTAAAAAAVVLIRRKCSCRAQ